MTSKLDDSDFIDRDLESATETGTPSSSVAPPSREELTTRVTETQQEEARKRRTELATGREEMMQHLTRGIGLLEEAELANGRTVEQLAATVSDLQGSLAKINGIDDQKWTEENWNVELTKALTTIENARMEWNSARLKWPLLDGETAQPTAAVVGHKQSAERPSFEQYSFWQLSRLGLAFTWPLVAVGVAIVILLILGSK